MKIGKKMVLSSVAITLMIILIGSSIFIIQGTRIIEDEKRNILESIVVIKEGELNSFFDSCRVDMEEITAMDCLWKELNKASELGWDAVEMEEVRERFKKRLDYTPFSEIFIMDTEGLVRLSTDPDQEGKIKSDERYFINGRDRVFIQSLYYDISVQKSASTISSPLIDGGRLVGVIAARIDLDVVSDIMTDLTGLGETGETYLVNRVNLLVSKSRFIEGIEFRKTLYGEAVKDCLNGNDGHMHYVNYRGVMVGSTYRWNEEIGACLLAEIEDSEIYSAVTELQYSVFAISIILSFFAAFILVILSITITKPITELRDFAIEVGKGKLNRRIKIESGDEIGELAESINQMVKDLEKSRDTIETHADELEERVEKRTKELNEKVRELTDTKTAVLNMMEDIDETNKQLIKTQRELRRSLSELERMDVKKNEFISIAAHELKTPLTSIHGFSQLLQERKISANVNKREKYLRIMDNETRRLANLVDDILDLSRIDLGALKFTLSGVKISEVIDSVKKEMEVPIRKRGLRSEYDIERSIPDIITDRERLTEVLLNLINNAINYTPKGKITIRVFRKGDYIHFIVKDTGIGIPKNEKERIFERFYQIDSSYTRKVGGTGLGLALCKEFVDMMGGRIWVVSTVGKGSEFHFTLPLRGGLKKDAMNRAKSKVIAKSLKSLGIK